MQVLSLAVCAITLSIVYSPLSYGQHVSHTTPRGQDPPGTIDGAKTPELIPEDAAWRMFIIAVAEPENPTPEQLARMGVKLNRVSLSWLDTTVLVRSLAHFHKQFATLRTELSAIPPASSRAVQTRTTIEQLFLSTRTELMSQLSMEGAAKLRQHVLGLREKIKSVPVPAMPQ